MQQALLGNTTSSTESVQALGLSLLMILRQGWIVKSQNKMYAVVYHNVTTFKHRYETIVSDGLLAAMCIAAERKTHNEVVSTVRLQ